MNSSLSLNSNLYSFGSGQGDIRMPSLLDGASSAIPLPTCFYVGKTRHRNAYVYFQHNIIVILSVDSFLLFS